MAYLHIVHFYAHVYIGVCFLFGYDLKKLIDFLSLTTYNKETGDSKLKLANWFEIDEMEYIEYILKGYTISVDEDWVEWQLDDQLHRTDGPAVIWADGSRAWWLHGQRHRADGSAVIYASGGQMWCLNGQLHRTDGPAIIWADGAQHWYLNGMKLTKDEWRQQVEAKQLV
jgi:hypothetical protein